MTPEWLQMMARYNAWQNASLFGAADGLDDVARKLDRGAFFGSIHETLSHLLWGDLIWMSRFDGGVGPDCGIHESGKMITDWGELKRLQLTTDQRILAWATGIAPHDFEGDLSWFSGAVQKQMSMPREMLFTHFFNHQTHHRGQVHAMLTAAGAKPDDTDLIFMPEGEIRLDATG